MIVHLVGFPASPSATVVPHPEKKKWRSKYLRLEIAQTIVRYGVQLTYCWMVMVTIKVDLVCRATPIVAPGASNTYPGVE